jgi:CRP/FNR family cyclic AMP-dependent transcriptional regulator
VRLNGLVRGVTHVAQTIPGRFDVTQILEGVEDGRSTQTYAAGSIVFSQGEPADAVFFLQRGRIKVSLLSARGKEAVLALLSADEFFGEGCLAGQSVRMMTAAAITPCTVVRIERTAMLRMLQERPSFADTFMTHLLSRNIRIEEDLTDQLFNSCEKRLARVLLLLANFGKETLPEPVIAKISQQTLADMVGTTRSRVSFFMNKFRRLGLIDYDGGLTGLHVHSSLLNVVLHD